MNLRSVYFPAAASIFVIFATTIAVIAFQLGDGVPFIAGSPAEIGDDVFAGLAVVSLIALAGLEYRSDRWMAFLWLILAAAFCILPMSESTGFENAGNGVFDVESLLKAIVLFVTALAIAPVLFDSGSPGRPRLFFGAALILQSIAFAVHPIEDAGAIPSLVASRLEDIGEISELLYLVAFLSGLAFVAVPLVRTILAQGVANNNLMRSGISRVGSALVSAPGRHAAIALEDISIWQWRRRHPGAPFSHYYAANIAAKLDSGVPHKTLGDHAWNRDTFLFNIGSRHSKFASEGLRIFSELQVPELHPGSYVIDYGCGSLRIGQHFMRTLLPGHYWGLDVTDRFYSDGLRLLDRDFVAAKQPNLALITKATIAEAAAMKPSLVYSVAVMKHVPETELVAYWRNLLSMLTPDGCVAVRFDRSSGNIRTAAMSWAHDADHIALLIRSITPNAQISFSDLSRAHSISGKPFRRCMVTVRGGF